ncbi:MAG TPA: DUF2459 domain-containing protein [Caulobacterales bacterium]|nr:DUF2459 domain-containing protein [Caulobacterales bacterium]
MKRPHALLAGCAAMALAAYLYVPLPPPDIPPARADDCVILHLWSNGYHSDLGVPAAALPTDHPLRMLFPRANTLLIGWGEQAFYYSDGRNLWLGLDAIVPPSPSVMHVVAGAEAGSAYLGPTADVRLAVSREGAASLGEYLRRALVLDGRGRVIVTTPGKVIGASYFLRARENFHLFNVCNHWMARALRAAGLNINWRDKWLGGPLVAAARRAAPAACPSAPGHPI